MNMMTPITGAVTGAAPPAAPAVEPIRPVPALSDTADTAGGDDPPSGGRGKGSPETTLRYKFDWLLQRQVSAGNMSSDKAAEMIRLFDRSIGGGEEQDEAPADDAGTTDPGAKDDAAEPAGRTDDGGEAAAALVERLRAQFAVDGPYDDTGSPSASMPVGLMVDSRS